MKVLNAHTSEHWETIPVFLNGFILQLPVFPLRARGNTEQYQPKAAFWGDPNNLEKLWFIVKVGHNGGGECYVPYSFVDPSSPSGIQTINSLINAEIAAADELPSEKECAQLRLHLEKLRRKYKKLLN